MEGERKIRVIETPPGPAPEAIRKQWVGVILPVAKDDDMPDGFWKAEPNEATLKLNRGGYIVYGTEAVDALRAAGKEGAAQFWDRPGYSVLLFGKAYCTPIKE